MLVTLLRVRKGGKEGEEEEEKYGKQVEEITEWQEGKDELNKEKEKEETEFVINHSTSLIPHRTCSAYFVLSDEPTGLRSFILSRNFESKLHHLGHYVFVTGSEAGSPKVILDNEVMAWRPNAILIRKVKKV
ncbi:hypothetical protein SK128_005236 [Halocaridina rubra]|uniref:Uncharacterized protein n=1 Tax=Halocaridina rubra TaxID=373956 RepID=A0AAN8WF75_HALRR